METKTVYFAKPGKGNTGEVLRVARQRAEELGITEVVVASTTGDTAAEAVRVFGRGYGNSCEPCRRFYGA